MEASFDVNKCRCQVPLDFLELYIIHEFKNEKWKKMFIITFTNCYLGLKNTYKKTFVSGNFCQFFVLFRFGFIIGNYLKKVEENETFFWQYSLYFFPPIFSVLLLHFFIVGLLNSCENRTYSALIFFQTHVLITKSKSNCVHWSAGLKLPTILPC